MDSNRCCIGFNTSFPPTMFLPSSLLLLWATLESPRRKGVFRSDSAYCPAQLCILVILKFISESHWTRKWQVMALGITFPFFINFASHFAPYRSWLFLQLRYATWHTLEACYELEGHTPVSLHTAGLSGIKSIICMLLAPWFWKPDLWPRAYAYYAISFCHHCNPPVWEEPQPIKRCLYVIW